MCPNGSPTEDEVIALDRRFATPILLHRLDNLERGHTELKSEMLVLKDCVRENTDLTHDIKNFLMGVKTTKKVGHWVYKSIIGVGALAIALAAIWVVVVAVETGQVPGSITAVSTHR